MIWKSLVIVFGFVIRLWSLLTFRCGGCDFELHWMKFDIRLKFNSPSKHVCV
jgi:hypothetical protein